MTNTNTHDSLAPTSTGVAIGKSLVNDMLNGRIALDISPNTFPRFPGANEVFDHRGFLDYLESDLGVDVLREMAQSNEQYLFV